MFGEIGQVETAAIFPPHGGAVGVGHRSLSLLAWHL
jgi:hypothetical protein